MTVLLQIYAVDLVLLAGKIEASTGQYYESDNMCHLSTTQRGNKAIVFDACIVQSLFYAVRLGEEEFYQAHGVK